MSDKCPHDCQLCSYVEGLQQLTKTMTDNTNETEDEQTTEEHMAEGYKEMADDCCEDDKLMTYDEFQEGLDLETPTCEYDDHVVGSYYTGDPDDNPLMAEMMVDINQHGEVHATVEEHEQELEIRKGTVTLDFDKGLIRFHDTPDGTRNVVAMNRIVDWYRPVSMWE